MENGFENDVLKSIEILKTRQQHPEITEHQIKVVLALAENKNSMNQLPTGSGKTWPVVCFPQILDILRDTLHYNLPQETRVLYVVPLINLYHSLSKEMEKLNIPYQIMNAGGSTEVGKKVKVVFVSPERLLNKSVMKSILLLPWSCVSIDEPHLALEWGVSKSKNRKPFREAFGKLNSLNNLGTVFEMHSATIENIDDLFQLVGRKNSPWSKQLIVPERPNLTYLLYSGKNAPDNILQLPCIKKCLLEEVMQGITMIYVQTIQEGSAIYISILDFCEKNNLINFPSHETSPNLPVSFLHSSLTEEKKTEIIEKATTCQIKILVATSAAGAGINLPVVQFVGWGLDRLPSGIIQSQGRTARNPYTGEGIVIWTHNPKLHGRRLAASSKVREVLRSDCFRRTTNNWFSHGQPYPDHLNQPEFCCSICMAACVEKSGCQTCRLKLEQFKPTLLLDNTEAESVLTDFLKTLTINTVGPRSTPNYLEESLSKEIVKHLRDKECEDQDETLEFLSIFSLGDIVMDKIFKFIRSKMFVSLSKCDGLFSETASESSESSCSSVPGDISDEYFDTESE